MIVTTYCHANSRNNRVFYSFSKIDHFIVKEDFIDSVEDASVLLLGENLSNHDAIYTRIKCESLNKISNDVLSKGSQPHWAKASVEHIQALVNIFKLRLQDIPIPYDCFNCRNLHCSLECHLESVDEYSIKVLTLLQQCVDDCIPSTNMATPKPVQLPFWKTSVKPIKEELNFWYSVWTSAGRPVNCQLHYIYRNVRHQYHYSVRKMKRYQQEIRNGNFLLAAMSGKVNNLLKTLKTQRKGKSQISSSIDNIQGHQEISNHFQSMYEKIYNHHSDRMFF